MLSPKLGTHFRWRYRLPVRKCLQLNTANMDSLLGTALLGKDGNVNTTEALAGKKAVALYFSAQ